IAETSEFGIQTLVNIVPRNPIAAAVNMDMLGVIFFGLTFGAALTVIPAEKAGTMIGWLEGLNEVVTRIIHFAMIIAPYGVAALIFAVASRFGFDLLAAIAAYVITVLVALVLHAGVTLSLAVRFLVGLSPVKFYSRVKGALITAFSTSASRAALPTTISVAEEELGIPRTVAGFVLPLGATICMNGTAIFEGITVIFIAQIFGVDLSLPQMAIVVAMSV